MFISSQLWLCVPGGGGVTALWTRNSLHVTWWCRRVCHINCAFRFRSRERISITFVQNVSDVSHRKPDGKWALEGGWRGTKMILKCILKKLCVRMWPGFSWFRVQTSGLLLGTWVLYKAADFLTRCSFWIPSAALYHCYQNGSCSSKLADDIKYRFYEQCNFQLELFSLSSSKTITATQVAKKCPACHGTRHWSVSWATSVLSTSSHRISLRVTLLPT
jgi:hypothetical protein